MGHKNVSNRGGRGGGRMGSEGCIGYGYDLMPVAVN